MGNEFVFSIFVIFCGASVIATLALFGRQSLLVGYILLGIILGPSGLSLVSNHKLIEQVGHFGIIFLLFLLGLNLQPKNLIHLLRQTTLTTTISSIVFALLGYGIAQLTGFTGMESLIIGTCMMFSSTILGLKLLPTTVLHHQKSGEVVVSILLLQDIIAIFVMLMIHHATDSNDLILVELGEILFSLPCLMLGAVLIARYPLNALFKCFSRIHEYLFLLAIGWCLTVGQLAEWLHLSFEVGAFLAGVSLATNPISRFIAESLRPIRDFFLILFFFSLGAGLDLLAVQEVMMPAALLAIVTLCIKPMVFSRLIERMEHLRPLSWELGIRLGQISEFSLLVAYVAYHQGLISFKAQSLIQITTILTFMASSYYIVARYPTPIALSDKLRRD
jgi:Kef-type K+ transport system membrane component KefB